MTTTITAKAKAFSGEGIREHSFEVDDDGTVRVWDSVAGHYTTCHSLSVSARRHIRSLALYCPLCGKEHAPDSGQPGYSCAN